jgi:cell shape-determining protein MreC
MATIANFFLDEMENSLILWAGCDDGIRKGSLVLHNDMLFAKITEVSKFYSKALLLSDSRVSVPIKTAESGIDGIMFGSGSPGTYVVKLLESVRRPVAGEAVFTSGTGLSYPAGLCVGYVNRDNDTKSINFFVSSFKNLVQLKYCAILPVGSDCNYSHRAVSLNTVSVLSFGLFGWVWLDFFVGIICKWIRICCLPY